MHGIGDVMICYDVISQILYVRGYHWHDKSGILLTENL